MRKFATIELINQNQCIVRVESEELFSKFRESDISQDTTKSLKERISLFITGVMCCTISPNSKPQLPDLVTQFEKEVLVEIRPQ
jgi:hypothetical protein